MSIAQTAEGIATHSGPTIASSVGHANEAVRTFVAAMLSSDHSFAVENTKDVQAQSIGTVLKGLGIQL